MTSSVGAPPPGSQTTCTASPAGGPIGAATAASPPAGQRGRFMAASRLLQRVQGPSHRPGRTLTGRDGRKGVTSQLDVGWNKHNPTRSGLGSACLVLTRGPCRRHTGCAPTEARVHPQAPAALPGCLAYPAAQRRPPLLLFDGSVATPGRAVAETWPAKHTKRHAGHTHPLACRLQNSVEGLNNTCLGHQHLSRAQRATPTDVTGEPPFSCGPGHSRVTHACRMTGIDRMGTRMGPPSGGKNRLYVHQMRDDKSSRIASMSCMSHFGSRTWEKINPCLPRAPAEPEEPIRFHMTPQEPKLARKRPELSFPIQKSP